MPKRRRIGLAIFVLILVAWGLVRLLPTRRLAPLPANETATAKQAAPAEIKYVGMKACAKCHADEYHSYLGTAHSSALVEVEANEQPPDAQFAHAPSGRSYRVYRDGDVFRHREWLTSVGEEGPLQDFPMKYLMGSGRHTRSYLFEDAGFLLESPITWYESRQSWGMSPGYDQPRHMGFGRGAGIRCVACHVGRAETVDRALDRVAIHELAIGCESCHGPGAAHVKRRGAEREGERAATDGIINPGGVSRELSEAICAQCHLQSAAAVNIRGRSMADFRPGRPLNEYRIDYQLDRPAAQMSVVGHVEQMHLSQCYQRSDLLTCITCHNPHATAPPERATAEYREKCLKCHTTASCGLEPAVRERKQPGDNCLACHMPQVATDIPHIAFTHHRIGIHDQTREAANDEERTFADLKPMTDISHLSELEQDRCLGLANLEFALLQTTPDLQRRYSARAAQLLESVRDRGAHDGSVDAGLARIYSQAAPQRVAHLARAALQDPLLSPSDRVIALFALADFHFRQQQWTAAVAALEPLTRLRRSALDWMLLGFCRVRLGDESRALEALHRAAEIDPFSRDIHAELANLYQRQQQFQRAERHRRLSQELAPQSKASPKDK